MFASFLIEHRLRKLHLVVAAIVKNRHGKNEAPPPPKKKKQVLYSVLYSEVRVLSLFTPNQTAPSSGTEFALQRLLFPPTRLTDSATGTTWVVDMGDSDRSLK